MNQQNDVEDVEPSTHARDAGPCAVMAASGNGREEVAERQTGDADAAGVLCMGIPPTKPDAAEEVNRLKTTRSLPRYGIKHLIDGDNVLDWPRDLRKGPDVVIAADADAQIAELRTALTASESLLALTNEALAACQAQAAGKIRELEARLRAARYDDEIDDGDMDDDEQDGYCDCGATHSEGTEEMDSGQCSACGGII